MLQAFKALFKVYLLHIIQRAIKTPELVTNELDPMSPCWEAELISTAITPHCQGFLASEICASTVLSETYKRTVSLEFACDAPLQYADMPSSTKTHNTDWRKLRLLQVCKLLLKVRLRHLWKKLHQKYSSLADIQARGYKSEVWSSK